MQEIILKESKEHGDISFPFAYYHVTSSHPRYVMETHWHEEYEICRVLEGELKVTIDGQTYMGKGSNGNGDIFIFNSGSVHSAEPISCVYECMVSICTSYYVSARYPTLSFILFYIIKGSLNLIFLLSLKTLKALKV